MIYDDKLIIMMNIVKEEYC